MTKFKYIGGDENAPQVTVAFGHKFVLNGDAVEVADANAIKKLSGNKSFLSVVDTCSQELPQPPLVPVEAPSPPAPEPEVLLPAEEVVEEQVQSKSEPPSYNEMCDIVKKADGGHLKSSKKAYVESRYKELMK